jgi:hypothetical protein
MNYLIQKILVFFFLFFFYFYGFTCNKQTMY